MVSKGVGKQRPYEKFVREYMTGYAAGESSEQIAKRCQTTKGALFVHAAYLRRQGVKLPKLTDRFDARYLNGIIRGFRKPSEKQTA